jgi:hypothetical protein
VSLQVPENLRVTCRGFCPDWREHPGHPGGFAGPVHPVYAYVQLTEAGDLDTVMLLQVQGHAAGARPDQLAAALFPHLGLPRVADCHSG